MDDHADEAAVGEDFGSEHVERDVLRGVDVEAKEDDALILSVLDDLVAAGFAEVVDAVCEDDEGFAAVDGGELGFGEGEGVLGTGTAVVQSADLAVIHLNAALGGEGLEGGEDVHGRGGGSGEVLQEEKSAVEGEDEDAVTGAEGFLKEEEGLGTHAVPLAGLAAAGVEENAEGEGEVGCGAEGDVGLELVVLVDAKLLGRGDRDDRVGAAVGGRAGELYDADVYVEGGGGREILPYSRCSGEGSGEKKCGKEEDRPTGGGASLKSSLHGLSEGWLHNRQIV
ncbi:MAG: hypothetical protein HIU93_15250 [Acidobacteria bacterium]|nr:hypothetical protein [Acidobacteriota bacterium]MBW4044321.1 hypothetical protein [Acidobacteriota bacterium]